ncbi:hypothetical protein CO180_03295 [candidate division WWE3 bacterium CG_4_9_14_3_um_filter_41_6]|uniref:R3H domain-containing protein n=1 Tax=candidate division WWE3 bacterium CG_4_10_14_0_2_um_filter_41_14 TaxID=1975072 RepID=A0A2M7TM55_UNCKA|nr:MAG: hypothetical protein COY32_00100 [candidate division WWE3 bacterium CG_4_10_14_0_2_um_filter_41_14]PJA38532.1 MAG: hypothetical protein CO180_03295 [candidate division WWE3 bacterium CG_4_9_14_3_um_filter_41_6]
MDLKMIQTLQMDVDELLKLMGIDYVVPEVSFGESQTLMVELKLNEGSEDKAGIIIGSHGETLLALEYAIALIVNKGTEGEWQRVELDIDGYRKRRELELKELAFKMADKAVFMKQDVHMNAMSSADRRIVHTILTEYAGVTTESDGEGRMRHVVIKPQV